MKRVYIIAFFAIILFFFSFRSGELLGEEGAGLRSTANFADIRLSVMYFEFGGSHAHVVTGIAGGLVYSPWDFVRLGFDFGFRWMEIPGAGWEHPRSRKPVVFHHFVGAGAGLRFEFYIPRARWFRLFFGIEGDVYYWKAISGLFNVIGHTGFKLDVYRGEGFILGADLTGKMVFVGGAGRLFESYGRTFGGGLGFFIEFL